MNLPTNILGLIVSYLDRCEDIPTRDILVDDLSEDEKKEVDIVWLKNTTIVCSQDPSDDTIAEQWTMNGKLHRERAEGDLRAEGVPYAIIYRNGTRIWYRNGKKHRDRDLPAVLYGNEPVKNDCEWWVDGKRHRDTIDENGALLPAVDNFFGKEWWIDGERHRGTGSDPRGEGPDPALIYYDGNQKWFRHGKLHRGFDLPAHTTHYDEFWFQDGELHRDNDKPAHIRGWESKWYQHGKPHRTTKGPDGKTLHAVYYRCGDMVWYQNGKKHRDDVDEKGELLPAVVCHTGVLEWWIDGKMIKTIDAPTPREISGVTENEIRECTQIGKLKEIAKRMGYKGYSKYTLATIEELRENLLTVFE